MLKSLQLEIDDLKEENDIKSNKLKKLENKVVKGSNKFNCHPSAWSERETSLAQEQLGTTGQLG